MTEQAFKVGDKVEHNDRGRGEVAFGPFDHVYGDNRYVVKLETGKHTMARARNLTAISAFAVGDKATCGGKEVSVLAGPFTNRFHTWYAIDMPGTGHTTGSESDLTSMPTVEPIKVGDKVRVVVDDPGLRTGEFVGLVGTVKDSNGFRTLVHFGTGEGVHGDKVNGRWWCEQVEKVGDANTFEYAGVTYEYGVSYKDRDGDRWTFRRPLPSDETEHPGYGGVPRSDSSSFGEDSSIAYVVGNYGPLRKV